MKIALLGYGKMGRAIEEIAFQKNHEIVLRIQKNNATELTKANLQKADIAIEFTGPHSAESNIKKCIEYNTPVVCGSTGWLQHWKNIVEYCTLHNGTFLYASNFSIGVNLFFELNKYLAQLMSAHTEYDVSLKEIHHTEKKDSPSGTAITLAEQILACNTIKKQWVNESTGIRENLIISSERKDPAAGTHVVTYHSSIDDITISHTAHNRKGFATGAVLAAEFLYNKKGIFSMKDVMGL